MLKNSGGGGGGGGEAKFVTEAAAGAWGQTPRPAGAPSRLLGACLERTWPARPDLGSGWRLLSSFPHPAPEGQSAARPGRACGQG